MKLKLKTVVAVILSISLAVYCFSIFIGLQRQSDGNEAPLKGKCEEHQ